MAGNPLGKKCVACNELVELGFEKAGLPEASKKTLEGKGVCSNCMAAAYPRFKGHYGQALRHPAVEFQVGVLWMRLCVVGCGQARVRRLTPFRQFSGKSQFPASLGNAGGMLDSMGCRKCRWTLLQTRPHKPVGDGFEM